MTGRKYEDEDDIPPPSERRPEDDDRILQRSLQRSRFDSLSGMSLGRRSSLLQHHRPVSSSSLSWLSSSAPVTSSPRDMDFQQQQQRRLLQESSLPSPTLPSNSSRRSSYLDYGVLQEPAAAARERAYEEIRRLRRQAEELELKLFLAKEHHRDLRSEFSHRESHLTTAKSFAQKEIESIRKMGLKTVKDKEDIISPRSASTLGRKKMSWLLQDDPDCDDMAPEGRGAKSPKEQHMVRAPRVLEETKLEKSVAEDDDTISPAGASNFRCIPVTTDQDEACLSEYQQLIRQSMEFFEFDPDHTEFGRMMQRDMVASHQVGIRCRFCGHRPLRLRAGGCQYFPRELAGVYQAAQNLARNHLMVGCRDIPPSLRRKIVDEQSKKKRRRGGKGFWVELCAVSGLYEKDGGLFFKDEVPTAVEEKAEKSDGVLGSR